MDTEYPIAQEFFAEIWRALDGDEAWLDRVRFHGDGALPSAWAVTDFAAATLAVAGAAVGETTTLGGNFPRPLLQLGRLRTAVERATDLEALPASFLVLVARRTLALGTRTA